MKTLLRSFQNALLHATDDSEISDCDEEGQSPLTENDITEHLQTIVQEKLEALSKKGEVKIFTRRVNVKEKVVKAVSFIQSTQGFISAAVAADPHAALAWAGILVVLPILTRTITEETDAVDGFNRVSKILVRCRVIEENYFAHAIGTKPKSSSQALEASARESMIKLYARILEYEIRFALYLSKKKPWRFLSNLTVSDDWNGILKDIDSNQEEIRKDLEAINSTEWKNIEKMTDNWNSISRSLQEQLKRNEEDRERDAKNRLRDRLDSIPFAPGAAFDSRDNQHSTCLGNTRVELLAIILAWAQCDDEKEIFWLKGVAGTGKSTIARTIAEKLHADGYLVGSFFFSRGQGDRGNAKLLVTSIAKQLAEQDPHARNSICNTYQQGFTDKSLSFQWKEIIQKPLSQVEGEIGPLILIIDALDECVEPEISSIIKIFAQGERRPGQTYRIFITSRPETAIRFNFQQIDSTIFYDLALDQTHEPETKRDIRTYIEHHMREIRESKGLGESWPREDQISELLKRADRLFVYAAAIYRYLKSANDPPKSLERILDTNTPDSSMKALDNVYAQILENYLSCGNYDELDDQIQLFQQIVGTIIVLSEPLSIRSLALLLDIPEYQVRSTLNPLYSVLDLPEDPESPIKIFHQSFRDFLVQSDRCNIVHKPTGSSIRLWVNEQDKHQILVSRCLETLTRSDSPLRRNICRLPNDGTLRTEIDDATIQANLPPELQYSCRYWANHLEQSGLVIKDGGETHKFLETHLLHWLEAMSILGLISEAVLCIAKLELPENDNKSAITEFLSDAKRFVLKNREVADLAPLQLYSSALIFVPESCIVRNIFKDQIPEPIKQLPRVERSWGALLQTLEGHTRPVNSISFSTDGRRLASGSDDGTIKLWDTPTGALRQTIEDYVDEFGNMTGITEVKSVAFSPDGQKLASGGNGCVIKLRDPVTGAFLQDLKGHISDITSVAFSSDGRHLVSGGADDTVRVWETATGALLRTLHGHAGIVWDVAFSCDSGQLSFDAEERRAMLASCSWDGTVMLWNGITSMPLKTLRGHAGNVRSVAFSPDCSQLASAGDDTAIRLWDIVTGEPLKTLSGHTKRVMSVAFSPNSRWLASGGGDNKVILWDLMTGKPLRIFTEHTNEVQSVTFSPDSQRLAGGSVDQTVRIWDISKDAPQETVEGHSGSVAHLAFSSDNCQVATFALEDPSIKIWETASGALLKTLEAHGSSIRDVAFSPNGRWIASCAWKGPIAVWDLKNDEFVQMPSDFDDHVSSVCFSRDSKWLASSSGQQEKNITLLETATYASPRILTTSHTDEICAMTFSEDGKWLASTSIYGTIELLETRAHKTIGTIETKQFWIRTIAFSPDGLWLACSTHHETTVWDINTTTLQKSIKSERYNRSLRFLEDGTLETDHGIFNIAHTDANDPGASSKVPRQIGVQDHWVVFGGQRILWLPPNYRQYKWVVRGGLLCIGTRAGRVFFLRLDMP
ncbi:hypothetical protein ASPWEDRAFT_161656 [Aspergillus wentii DTO 134E9]|uniref:Uncharacterized protein n=1 Tax=Aspergillus wentii DTO 134E9 TaxID=1073089 RepID=A0A1L9RBK2_ASPWE|nr:uncharacterized protein ASPWEDRAFT_161656 [Aspergillus wentii DTO 134E9]OJJ32237.1 hypothetical protein ASPWEDRAFT_161656 [Aspergillus wentii DTO 134E9]